jgi:hypothetical protein
MNKYTLHYKLADLISEILNKYVFGYFRAFISGRELIVNFSLLGKIYKEFFDTQEVSTCHLKPK